ncbi:MAG: hypothetical protein MUO76_06520 [Anaerolineaceae bacterium]|nr:hypothetical protein [Anaerolineaceae bacterium]
MESAEMAAEYAMKAFRKGDFSLEQLSGYRRALIKRYAADWRAARLLRQIIKYPHLLNHVFKRMQGDHKRALLFFYLILNHVPQRNIFRPKTMFRLLA